MVMTSDTAVNHAKACLLGGAIGDALGAPIEFMSTGDIIKRFGAQGIRDYYPAYGRTGAITDDTQMTLFTAEGLIRGLVRGYTRGIASIPSVIHHALCRWLLTQGMEPGQPHNPVRSNLDRSTGLILERRLWSARAPGNTCITSLRSVQNGFGAYAENQSKGCGGVMRAAPCAFGGDAFENASESARMTHGHPTGYLSAGLFAHILHELFKSERKDKDALLTIALAALERYRNTDGMAETDHAITTVLMFVKQGIKPSPHLIDEFGRGWIAEEALAIALWCALAADSFEEGVIMAVNHSGDSDSTGAIAGNLLGLMYGLTAIPPRWLDNLELRDVIERIAADLIEIPIKCWQQGEDLDNEVYERYPGF